MAEAAMPQGCGQSKVGMGSGSARDSWESVDVTVAVATKCHLPRVEVFNGETQSVKFDGTVVVTSKLTNRKKVTN
jgi:hypothetical protein